VGIFDDPVKNELLAQIDADRDQIVTFLREFVRRRSPNPPGVTTPAADFVRSFFERHQLAYREIAPAADRPNFLASMAFADGERHLVLNGHIDVFPVEDHAAWSVDPWGGDLIDGKIYGRGAADMKCGTTASIWTYLYLGQRAQHLSGRLTLTAVSEEENFSPLGMRYLMDHHLDEVLGTCCLNGEPSSPYSVRFGEKAPFWLKFTVRTKGGHGAYVHVSKNAALIALDLILELRQIAELPFQEPAEVAATLDRAAADIDRAYGAGASESIRRVTFNLGTIRAGVKVNMIAAECEFEADFRLPNGVRSQDLLARVEEVVSRYPEVTMEILNRGEPNWCEPDHRMMDIVRENAFRVGGMRPAKVVSPGATDARLWRLRGVPAVVYGPTPNGMGSADEYVSVEELMHVVKCHALSAYDYLSEKD
jgi:succinyl-diaminopimelate desuccinylase